MLQVSQLWNYRQLVRQLAVRDLKARYKVSVLGFLWSLLRPLLTIVVMAGVFSMLDLKSERYDVSYPTLLLASYIPWFFFSTTLLEGTQALLSNANLIKKVYAPRVVYPTAVVASNLVNFLSSFLVLLLIVFVFTSAKPTWMLLQLPLVIFFHSILTLGFCYLASALNVLYRDTTQVMEFGVFVWFYITPVLYDVLEVFNRLPRWGQVLYFANPMAGMIEWYRYILLNSQLSNVSNLSSEQLIQLKILLFSQFSAFSSDIESIQLTKTDLHIQEICYYAIPYSILVSILLLIFSSWLFKRLETRVVDAI